MQNPISIHVEVANMRPDDARFLSDVIRLYCDPLHATKLDALRSGSLRICYGPQGRLDLIPIDQPTVSIAHLRD